MGPSATKPILYMDHPLGERSNHEWMHNIASAGRWFQWLFRNTPCVITAPWWPYAVLVDVFMEESRIAADSMLLLDHSNVYVQCGPCVSAHMREREDYARRRQIRVCDLTSFSVSTHQGLYPPGPPRDSLKFNRALAELEKALDQT